MSQLEQIIKEYLSLNEETGVLTWSKDRWRAVAGSVAGRKNKDGYRYVKILYRHRKEHRVIFFIKNGRWPNGTIDHINGVKDDNRPCNLREVSNAENQRSFRSKPEGCTSKYRGVYFSKDRQQWKAQVFINGVNRGIGSFKSEIEAALARDAEAIRLGFHPSSLNCQ